MRTLVLREHGLQETKTDMSLKDKSGVIRTEKCMRSGSNIHTRASTGTTGGQVLGGDVEC